MQEVHINHFAVWVCALLNLGVGGLWYSPLLFGKSWMKEAEMTDEKIKQGNPAVSMGFAFLLSVIISYNLAFFIGGPDVDWKMGLLYGFLTGFGWVTMGLAIVAKFEARSVKYILINGGFLTVYFSLTGLILGAWR